MKNLSHLVRFGALAVSFFAVTNGYAQTYYYSKSTGSLSSLTSWGTTTTGGGTAPTSFSRTNTIWVIQNNASPTITANWTVSGTGSRVVVGNGSAAINFTIPSNKTFTGKIDVTANARLTITNTSIPTLGSLAATSTVIYNANDAQDIQDVTYGNLTYSGSDVGTMDGSCTIAGNFSVTNGEVILDDQNTDYVYSIGGDMAVSNAIVDFGADNRGGQATINLDGDLIQSGSGGITTSGSTANGTINFTGTATQNLKVQYSSYVNYNINSGSTVTLTGGFNTLSSPGYSVYIAVNSGAILNCGTNIMTGNTSAYNNFTLYSGATLITANTNGINSSGFSGSIQSINTSFSSGANYVYNGSSAQGSGVFTTTPTAKTVNNLTINNSAGVTLDQAVSVGGMLTFTNGVLNTTNTNLITIKSGANYTGASDNSFVDGPIAEVGSTSFVFPVGVTGIGMVPIAINGTQGSSSTFRAQYFRGDANLLGLILAGLGLDHVSHCDYWRLDRTSGSATINVTAYWNAHNSCNGPYITNTSALALAHFDDLSSLTWNKFGGTVTSGNASAGTITWNNVSNFSPFALSSTTTSNPLPLNLLNFNAKWQTSTTVGLTWETAQEENTNHFTIQRSADGVSWQPLGNVAAAGTSATTLAYSYTDANPLASLNYYRLMMVDNDGSTTYSEVKVVSKTVGGITIFPNPATDHINISFGVTGMSGIVNIRLLNAGGQVLLQKKVTDPAGQTITLPVASYPPGTYLVQVFTPDGAQQSRVVMIK